MQSPNFQEIMELRRLTSRLEQSQNFITEASTEQQRIIDYVGIEVFHSQLFQFIETTIQKTQPNQSDVISFLSQGLQPTLILHFLETLQQTIPLTFLLNNPLSGIIKIQFTRPQ